MGGYRSRQSKALGGSGEAPVPCPALRFSILCPRHTISSKPQSNPPTNKGYIALSNTGRCEAENGRGTAGTQTIRPGVNLPPSPGASPCLPRCGLQLSGLGSLLCVTRTLSQLQGSPAQWQLGMPVDMHAALWGQVAYSCSELAGSLTCPPSPGSTRLMSTVGWCPPLPLSPQPLHQAW